MLAPIQIGARIFRGVSGSRAGSGGSDVRSQSVLL